jgi:hypothetical protein
MKKMTMFFLFWLMFFSSEAQVNPAPKTEFDQVEYDRLMRKSRNLKITGWSMFGVGAVVTTGGFVWLAAQTTSDILITQDDDTADGPGITFAVGLLTMLGSIPVLVSASNAKKKARLMSTAQPLTFNGKSGQLQPLPSLSLRLSLGH